MDDTEALKLAYILDCGLPICEAISEVIKTPPELVPKVLGTYIKKMAEAIEPGGINNTKLVKYLISSTGAIIGLMIARAIRTAEE
ncbi:MAG: hypothetical protein KIG84_10115 [Bacteroidales bacterium]|nr:hypothetical protein [Bacteroidales bacterium]